MQYHIYKNRQTETRNASVLTYVYAPAGSNWLYQRGSDTRSKQANGNGNTTSGSTFGTLAYDGYNRIAQLPMENSSTVTTPWVSASRRSTPTA